MTRQEYLQELRLRLSHRVDAAELERLMGYYETYFDEAGPAGEQRVISELGTPELLVKRIMGERASEQPEQPDEWYAPPEAGLNIGWKVALGICFVLFVLPVAFVLAAGFSLGGAVCVVYGAATALVGFSNLLAHGMATAMFFMGGGAVTAGIGLLLLAGAAGIAHITFRSMAWLLSRRRRGWEEQA